MDNKKRTTTLRHTCSSCYKSYSRLWVLKRHYLKFHGNQAPGDSSGQVNSNSLIFPKGFETLIQMELLREIKELNSKLSGVEFGVPSDPTNLKAMKLAIKMIKPSYNDIMKERTTLQNWLNLYVPFPKVLVSGFSCYLCPRCLAQELPIPIKDLGVDLTCEARHRCRAGSHEFNNLTSDRKSLELKLASYIFTELNLSIDLWIPGKKLIYANKISVPNGEDNDTIRKYVQEKYNIPNKYHLVDVNVKRSAWLPELLRNGQIEPTSEQLDDFCAYCLGTYAIFRIRDWDSFEYYTVFLASAE